MTSPAERGSKIEIVSIDGNPSVTEWRAITDVLQQLITEQAEARNPSLWLRSSRSQGRRLGMLDYRDRFAREDAWRLSTRFPFGGREYQGRWGRGDSK